MEGPKYLGAIVGKPVLSKPKEASYFVIPDAKVGIEIEFERWDGSTLPEHEWEIHTNEGSIRNNGIEFVTAGNGVQGLDIIDRLSNFCKKAKACKWSTGEPRAAIHIHLDVTDLDLNQNQLARLVSNYILVESIFFAYAGDWRKDCGFCVPYSTGQIDFKMMAGVLHKPAISRDDFNFTVSHLSKYQALNLNPITRFGTVEFRHLPTTFDLDRILFWINMVLGVKKSASLKFLEDPLLALSTHGPEAIAAEIFGPCYPELRKYVSPAEMWGACDTCTLLLAHAGKLKSPKRDEQDLGWAENAAEISPLIERKLALINKSKAKKRKEGELE